MSQLLLLPSLHPTTQDQQASFRNAGAPSRPSRTSGGSRTGSQVCYRLISNIRCTHNISHTLTLGEFSAWIFSDHQFGQNLWYKAHPEFWLRFALFQGQTLFWLIAVTGQIILLKLDSMLCQTLCIISYPFVNSKLSHSPEIPNLVQNWRFFAPCDPEIWWMTLKNNRATFCAISSFVHDFIAIGEFKLNRAPLLSNIRSYIPETAKLGHDLCDLDLLHGHHICQW